MPGCIGHIDRILLSTKCYRANRKLHPFTRLTGATLDDKNPAGWFPEQRITVVEAIEAYTLGAAYASFQEEDRGSITAGKLADLAVFERDILEGIKPGAAPKVALTIVGGRVVYEANGQRSK